MVVELEPPLGFELVLEVVLLELDELGSFSFTTVVLFSVFFSPGGLVTVVSFCSHAASNARPASKQMYFFIGSLTGLI